MDWAVLRSALDVLLRSGHPAPVLSFYGGEPLLEFPTIRRAVEAGVTAYIVDGLERRRVRPVVDEALARFAQYRALEKELERTRSDLGEAQRRLGEARDLFERGAQVLSKD